MTYQLFPKDSKKEQAIITELRVPKWERRMRQTLVSAGPKIGCSRPVPGPSLAIAQLRLHPLKYPLHCDLPVAKAAFRLQIFECRPGTAAPQQLTGIANSPCGHILGERRKDITPASSPFLLSERAGRHKRSARCAICPGL